MVRENLFGGDFDPDEGLVDEGKGRETAGTGDTPGELLERLSDFVDGTPKDPGEVDGAVVVDSESEPEPVQSGPEDGESENLEAQYQQAAGLQRQINKLQAQLNEKFPHLNELEKLNDTEYRSDPLFTQLSGLRMQLSELRNETSFGPAERKKLIEKYGLEDLYDGIEDPEHEAHGILNTLGDKFAELRIALLAEDDNAARIEFDLIDYLLNEFRQKFPDSEMSGAYVLTDVLGVALYLRLLDYMRIDRMAENLEPSDGFSGSAVSEVHPNLRQRLSQFFRDLGRRMEKFGYRRQGQATVETPTQSEPVESDSEEETAATAEEEQQVGRVEKAVKALLGKAVRDLPKSRKAHRAVFGLCGAATAAALGAPVTFGLTAGTMIYAGIRGAGLLKNIRRPSQPVNVRGFIKNLGIIANTKIETVGRFIDDFMVVREHEKTADSKKNRKFFINRVLEGTGLILGIPFGAMITFTTEVMPVSSLIKVSKTVLGISDIYAAGWLPRRFADIAGWMEKNEEKIRNIDKYSHENYKAGDELRKVAHAMAFTATCTVAAVQALKLAMRLSDTVSSKLQPQDGVQEETKLPNENVESAPHAIPTPQHEVSPEPDMEISTEQSPTGIDQPELEVRETAPEIKNGGSISDRTGLEPQASVGDVEELELKEIMDPKFTVKQGGTFWNSMKFEIPEGQNWEDKALTMVNGVPVNKEEVMRGVVTSLYDALGKQIREVPAGKVFDIGADLTEKQQDMLQRMLEEVMNCDGPSTYWNELRPKFEVELAQIAAEAMKPKGVN